MTSGEAQKASVPQPHRRSWSRIGSGRREAVEDGAVLLDEVPVPNRFSTRCRRTTHGSSLSLLACGSIQANLPNPNAREMPPGLCMICPRSRRMLVTFGEQCSHSRQPSVGDLPDLVPTGVQGSTPGAATAGRKSRRQGEQWWWPAGLERSPSWAWGGDDRDRDERKRGPSTHQWPGPTCAKQEQPRLVRRQ